VLDDAFDPFSVVFAPGSPGVQSGPEITWSKAEVPALASVGMMIGVPLELTARVRTGWPPDRYLAVRGSVSAVADEDAPCSPVERAFADLSIPWRLGALPIDLLRNAAWPYASLERILGTRTPNALTCGWSSLQPERDIRAREVIGALMTGLRLRGDGRWRNEPLVFYEITEECIPAEGGTDLPICLTRDGEDLVIRAAPGPGGCR
jgi:hypothetical protein